MTNILSILVLFCLIGLLVLFLKKLRNQKSEKLNLFKDVEKIKKEPHKIIKLKLSRWTSKFSDWTLLNYAHQYSWPKNIVLSLPCLVFCFKSVSGKTRIYIWNEVLNYLPPSISYKILNNYCGEIIVEIVVENTSTSIIIDIANCLENARLNNPYNSYHSLLGVINQNLNELEFEIKQSDNELGNDISKQRMKIFGKEFQLCNN